MTTWVIRAESKGESEQISWENNVISLGWYNLPDLSNKSKAEIKALSEEIYPDDYSPSVAGQYWAFIHDMQIGDFAVTPCLNAEFKQFIAVGQIIGDYEFKDLGGEVTHIRRVKWIERLPRSSFTPAIQKYFNLPGTLYRLNPIAEQQVREMLGDRVAILNSYEHPRNTIFYGPPGTGKTYKAFDRALEIINRDPSYCATKSREDVTEEFRRRSEDGQIEFITFHQSYSYEEFVEGIRPVLSTTDTDTNSIQYQITDGIFKKIALAAKAYSSENYVLIIDEINRGNISKIFGELITLIEEDKRLSEQNEIIVKLPYSQTKFGVPANLYIIGTMNSADRGIALIDIALRRRFTFEPFMPEYTKTGLEALSVDGLNLGNLLRHINLTVTVLLDQDHQLGHSYFIKVGKSPDRMQKLYNVWYQEIIPLLQEYFYNDYEKLEQVLGKYVSDAEGVKGFVERLSETDVRKALAGADEWGVVESYVGSVHKYESPTHLIQALKRHGK